jgi:hypothetical protein
MVRSSAAATEAEVTARRQKAARIFHAGAEDAAAGEPPGSLHGVVDDVRQDLAAGSLPASRGDCLQMLDMDDLEASG